MERRFRNERSHWQVATERFMISMIGTGVLILVLIGSGDEVERRIPTQFANQEKQPIAKEILEDKQVQQIVKDLDITDETLDCRTFEKGEWPLKLIRELGNRGIDDPPFIYTDKEGQTHVLKDWRDFGIVQPKEKLCVIMVTK